MTTLLVLVGLAAAADDYEQEPFIQPRLNASYVNYNGNQSAQVFLGADVGLKWKYTGTEPTIAGRHRLGVTGRYGLLSNTLGGEFRLGSFAGPHLPKILTWEVGPDFWYSGYVPKNPADDFTLPWSPGLDIRNALLIHPGGQDKFLIFGEATPGWAFDSDRQGGGLGPFHVFTLLGAVSIKPGRFGITLGYQKVWDAFGAWEGIIISGSI